MDQYVCGHPRGGENDQWFKNGKRESRRCRRCNIDQTNARGKAGRDAIKKLAAMPANVVSFDAMRASRYVEQALAGFLIDPADSEYQRGYLAALLTIYQEGLGKGAHDDRLTLLKEQV